MQKMPLKRNICVILTFIVILLIFVIINKRIILASYYKYRAYYAMNVSNSASYHEFLYYVEKFKDYSTEVELRNALLDALVKKSPTQKEISLLALAGKDTPQAHRIFEELLKNTTTKRMALRGLSKCKSYNPKQLFKLFAKDNKTIKTIVWFQVLENRNEALDDILKFYLKNVKGNEKDYTYRKIKKYLLNHNVIIPKTPKILGDKPKHGDKPIVNYTKQD